MASLPTWLQWSSLNLTVDVRHLNGHVVVALGGEVDVFGAPQLRDRLLGLIESGERRIVVDMDGLEFCDSSGLGVLIGGLRRARTNDGELSIACSRRKILRIFRNTGLEQVFTIYPSVVAAVASTSAHGKGRGGRARSGRMKAQL